MRKLNWVILIFRYEKGNWGTIDDASRFLIQLVGRVGANFISNRKLKKQTI